MNTDYDVIVLGGGGAGMAAALTATETGARVLLVEVADKLGGSTALSGGVYYAAGTRVQQARGIEGDTQEAAYLYYMALTQHKVEASLVRRFCDEAADGLEWLMSLGVEFLPEGLYVSGVDGIARGHSPTGAGAAIAEALEGALGQKSVDVVLRTHVNRLLVDPDGGLRGIVVGDDAITAGAVVIATGGFGANEEFLSRYYSQAAAQGDRAWYIGARTNRGDGIVLAQAVGADMTGFNRGLLLVTPGFAKDLEVFLPGWLMYVNRNGRRFINETTEYAVVSSVVNEQLGGECFAVFDEQSRACAPRIIEAGDYPLPSWEPESLEKQTAQGKIFRGATIHELARNAGIRADALEATIESYNASCDSGQDREYFKDSTNLLPVRKPPFYAVRMRPAIICLTSAGLRIDSETRVLNVGNRPVPGLFAAGETVGGILGDCYIGGGNSVTNAIVFGRAAGRSAAAWASSRQAVA
ncbi:fumarate reductase flavoprotein subunit [Steroidobacter denitrificans]|uniref:Fumarate reductase flavoprotein subunit n=1 Tax=Steroidobacter denitrificans TaxID=465721 RepID=A0A127FAX9_STEDE|nr:FAD-dependent oxidoreductase [Steroidobacter denitrificans]AMN47572.1 fumarate reductase flavoprotein subunit [Steroidobacter denitrificans]